MLSELLLKYILNVFINNNMFILFDLVLIHETEEVFSEHLSSFVKRYQ